MGRRVRIQKVVKRVPTAILAYKVINKVNAPGLESMFYDNSINPIKRFVSKVHQNNTQYHLQIVK